mmetsp:Transcript_4413/g.13922  ORF Transcript_4413/g.13922 Transcript_4413/m.13922 type:complete len:354 (+) Transcript_4413:775-1836(+)
MKAAFAGSASASTKTWQMPSAWPRTGTRVARWIFLTSWPLPRGTTRSMRDEASGDSSKDHRASRSSKSVTAAAATRPCDALTTAAWTISARQAFDLFASLPPFKSKAQPARRARAAICKSASGRASKTTQMTPRAVDRFSKMRPSANSRRCKMASTGSVDAASARRPSTTVASLEAVRPKRCRSAGAIFPATESAAATSNALASKIVAKFACTASATAVKIADRSAPSRACSTRCAARAPRAALAASSRRESDVRSTPLLNMVPISSPASTRATTFGSMPLARTTASAPNSKACNDEVTLDSMPPRPPAETGPKSKLSPGPLECTTRAPSLSGGRSYKPATSVRMRSTDAPRR